jgi:hypothetical protein
METLRQPLCLMTGLLAAATLLAGCTQADPLCGNGTIDANEVCDGAAVGATSCVTEGFAYGKLGCAADCRSLDTSSCTPAVCGNELIERDESCDGHDVGNRTCALLGFDTGVLVCKPDCSGLDLSSCAIVPVPGDTCDDALPLSVGVTAGSTKKAHPTFDTSCTGMGRDIVYALDLEVPSGLTIAVDGFDSVLEVRAGGCDHGSVVDCNDNVSLDNLGSFVRVGYAAAGRYFVIVSSAQEGGDFSMSVEVMPGGYPRCGDDTLQPELGEVCDGTALANKRCEDFQFGGGTLACGPLCRTFDLSGCTTSEVCGNGSIAGPEVCDGDVFAPGVSCRSLGYQDGILKCAGNCLAYDTSSCTGMSSCGDGVVDGQEKCEGTHWASSAPTCAWVHLGAGNVRCNDKCQFDFSSCETADLCAALNWYTDATCDPCELWGGHADPACAGCIADGNCVDNFNQLAPTLEWSCKLAGYAPDPDCGPCGDGVVTFPERCDGLNVDGEKCENFGYAGGTLGCRADCLFDFSGCTK